METIQSIEKMRSFVRETKKGSKLIGFVPTMGSLHEGHLSLIKEANKLTDLVIVSIFLNPSQFNEISDYNKYPKDLESDKLKTKTAGVDVLFNPSISEMYPEGYNTSVKVEKLALPLCGAHRPGHFEGVTTVVTKLFNIVQPDIAFFGQKDAQQAIVIKRMVKDLNWDIKIKVMPIIREKDGLAMSSRNIRLNKEERKKATILYKSLRRTEKMINSGEREPSKIIRTITQMIKPVSTKIDYISIVDAETLEEKKEIYGETLIALAVWIGKTRLIDNILIKSPQKRHTKI